jgi:general secretion pathway protein I
MSDTNATGNSSIAAEFDKDATHRRHRYRLRHRRLHRERVRAAAGVVDGAQRLADVTAAQWCADNQLTALKLSRQLPGVGDADFTCEQLGRSYSGTLRTQPTPNPNFRRVDAIVRNEAGQTLLTVSTVASRL